MERSVLIKLLWRPALVLCAGQILLLSMLYYYNWRYELKTMDVCLSSLSFPVISFLLILGITFFVSHGYLQNKILIYSASWIVLMVPELIPFFTQGFNIFYIIWTFILCTTTVGILIFHDICLVNKIDPEYSKKQAKLLYNEMKFYFDKIALAWLTLGSALTLIATILWTTSSEVFAVSLIERTILNAYMVFAFGID